MSKKVLVTGAAGFIGSSIAESLLARGDTVIGVDNLNDYYDVSLKKARLKRIEHPALEFHHCDILDREKMTSLFEAGKPTHVCHMAAQAGVRYSIENPYTYQKTNVEGTLNLLELVRNHRPENFVYASSSSVYGGNEKIPFSVEDRVDNPISLYAATKKTTELFAHVYSHLFGIKTTGLRFFTVYGPYGRPDMACYKFALKIMRGEPIDLYNRGEMFRDFTYVDDIVKGVIASIDTPFDYEIFNLGNSNMEQLSRFVEIIEENLGRKAEKNLLPMQPGDVPRTNADVEKSTRLLGFKPEIRIEEGLRRFFDWFKQYHADLF